MQAHVALAERGAVICENDAMMHARLFVASVAKLADIDFFRKVNFSVTKKDEFWDTFYFGRPKSRIVDRDFFLGYVRRYICTFLSPKMGFRLLKNVGPNIALLHSPIRHWPTRKKCSQNEIWGM